MENVLRAHTDNIYRDIIYAKVWDMTEIVESDTPVETFEKLVKTKCTINATSMYNLLKVFGEESIKKYYKAYSIDVLMDITCYLQPFTVMEISCIHSGEEKSGYGHAFVVFRDDKNYYIIESWHGRYDLQVYECSSRDAATLLIIQRIYGHSHISISICSAGLSQENLQLNCALKKSIYKKLCTTTARGKYCRTLHKQTQPNDREDQIWVFI